MLAGLLLFGASAVLLRPSEEVIWWQLLGCEVAAVLAGLWVSLKSPFIVERLLAFRREYLDRALYGEHYKLARYGWLALFVPASLTMFIREPGSVLAAVTAIAMTVAAMSAVYGAVPVLRPVGYVMVLALGWFAGSMIHDSMFPNQHIAACIAYVMCIHCLLMTHAMREHDLALFPGRLLGVRLAWVAGSVALILAPHLVPASYIAAPLLWLWVLAGAVIGTFSAPLVTALLLYVPLWAVTAASYDDPGLISDQRIVPMEELLLALMIYMVLSISQARRSNK
jgi:hypothetical protein